MELFIITIFLIGYLAITLEYKLKVNKSASALITGVLCWTIYVLNSPDYHLVVDQLEKHLSDVAAIVFFLLGAMTIVELIDLHNGFDFISGKISTKSKASLILIVGLVSFFLSAVLDNLTTTIVMITIVRKLVYESKERLYFAGAIVIAANAGGVWSPIGDVTTTMLWIGNQITSVNIIRELILPGLICAFVPIFILSRQIKGKLNLDKSVDKVSLKSGIPFFIGIGLLLFVPLFKILTNLPPYMGMFLVLGLVWILTEIVHYKKDASEKHNRSVAYALMKIDSSSILFFTGILLSVSALEASHILGNLASLLLDKLKNEHVIVFLIGLSSSVFDNVPLVAAAMGMFDISTYPTDHSLWEFLAYCSGTGGSILIIGSAAGVAAMGMEKIDFFWYLKKISLLALIGYIVGALVYLLISI